MTTHERRSLNGVLSHLQQQGIQPATVIDVGAAYGSWSRACSKIFSQAKYLLVEPLSEYEYALQETVAHIQQADYRLMAMSNIKGEQTMYVHQDLVGSSFKEEQEPHTQQSTNKRVVPCSTIDELCKDEQITGPYLLKFDIQGSELEAIAGAQYTIQQTEAVIMEVSLQECMKGTPLISDVIHVMRANGFVPYDLFGCHDRPIDDALAQVDIVFVPLDSPLFANKWYADESQRREMGKRFLQQRKSHGI